MPIPSVRSGPSVVVAVLILANFVLCVEELSCSGEMTGRACFYDFQLMFARNSRTTVCTYSGQAENTGRSFSGKLPLRAGKPHAISWSTVTQHSKIHYQEMGYAQQLRASDDASLFGCFLQWESRNKRQTATSHFNSGPPKSEQNVFRTATPILSISPYKYTKKAPF